MPAGFVSIAALLGKADVTFRYIGGSSIVFNFLRSYIFGKAVRTMEYPDGDLFSIKIYSTGLSRLKKSIAEVQPPVYPTAVLAPEDVRQIVLWTAPFFTERLRTDRDVYNVPDGAWLLWSKLPEAEEAIPARGVKLDAPSQAAAAAAAKKRRPSDNSSSTDEQQQALLQMCIRLYREGDLSGPLYEQLVQHAIESDSALLALSRAFSDSPTEFQQHALRMLQRRAAQGAGSAPAPRQEKRGTRELDV